MICEQPPPQGLGKRGKFMKIQIYVSAISVGKQDVEFIFKPVIKLTRISNQNLLNLVFILNYFSVLSNLNPVVLSIPIFFILIGVEVAYGYFKGEKIYRLNDAITNMSCGIVEQLTGVFAKVFTVAAYHFVFTHFAIFELQYAWYWIVICFLGVDLCYYWAHRMSHQVHLFWLGHVVHHQSEDYNLSVALRQSVFQKMFTFYFYLPLAFLGFKTEWFVLASAINLLYQFWIHTEVVKKMPRWFEFIFNTPSHHRVHHGVNPKYIDKNHAGSLIIWDKIFGTFQEEEERPIYGITSPVNTWNPVMANIQPFVILWREMKKIPGFWNKVKFTFGPPGWYPKEMGGYQPAPEVDYNTYQKFEITVSPQLNFYLFGQYVFVLGMTAFFLFTLADYNLILQLLMAGVIIYSVGTLGMMFENKRQAVVLEVIRFISTVVVAVYLFYLSIVPFWVPILFLSLAAVSLFILSKIGFHRISSAVE